MPSIGFPRLDTKCRLRWGAGGTAFETQFDYPQHGAIFGVTADTFDLVALFNDPSVVVAVPDIGAFMVPGVAADPTPLHWLETSQGLTVTPAAGSLRFWAVKPWARQVRISLASLGVGGEVQLSWLDTVGVAAYAAILAIPPGTTGSTFDFEIPAVATVMALRGLGPFIVQVSLDWQIGLT
jgi:hypothetical protein